MPGPDFNSDFNLDFWTVYIDAALAATEAPDALAFSSEVVVEAVLAATDLADVVALSSEVVAEAILEATEATDAVSLSGAVIQDEVIYRQPGINRGGLIVTPRLRIDPPDFLVGYLRAVEPVDGARFVGDVEDKAIVLPIVTPEPELPAVIISFADLGITEAVDEVMMDCDTFDWIAHDNAFLLMAA